MLARYIDFICNAHARVHDLPASTASILEECHITVLESQARDPGGDNAVDRHCDVESKV